MPKLDALPEVQVEHHRVLILRRVHAFLPDRAVDLAEGEHHVGRGHGAVAVVILEDAEREAGRALRVRREEIEHAVLHRLEQRVAGAAEFVR